MIERLKDWKTTLPAIVAFGITVAALFGKDLSAYSDSIIGIFGGALTVIGLLFKSE